MSTPDEKGYCRIFPDPAQNAKIEVIELGQAEQKLYDFFKQKAAKLAKDSATKRPGWLKGSSSKDSNILYFINTLRRIYNHGEQLLPSSAVEIGKGELAYPSTGRRCKHSTKDAKSAKGILNQHFLQFNPMGCAPLVASLTPILCLLTTKSTSMVPLEILSSNRAN